MEIYISDLNANLKRAKWKKELYMIKIIKKYMKVD